MLIGFKAITRGVSHIEQDKPCQDAADVFCPAPHTLGFAFIADGHGGEKYTRSETGSQFVVETAREVFKDFLLQISKNSFQEFLIKMFRGNQQLDPQKMDKAIGDMEKTIIYRWRNKVLDHAKNNPPSEEEQKYFGLEAGTTLSEDDIVTLYGTTLIAAAVAVKGFWFAIQIGDGACVIIPADGKLYIPEKLTDDSLGFGKTTSLCNKDAINHFRHCFKQENILGITVATDGVVDSFLPEKYLEFTEGLRNKFTLLHQETENELRNFLPELSERGSRDDCAIAGLFEVEKK